MATNGVYRRDFIEGGIGQFGADRVVFASAAPLVDPSYEVLRVRLAAVSEPDRAAVAGGTAAGLSGL